MPKVLVIDDEKAIDSVIKEILEAEQFVVDEGSNGAEALDKIQKEQFRGDLYHRLNVIHIAIPLLNSPREYIPILIVYFSNQMNKQYQQPKKVFDKKVMEYLRKLDYPGNVRQLRNIIERLYVLCEEDTITVHDLE